MKTLRYLSLGLIVVATLAQAQTQAETGTKPKTVTVGDREIVLANGAKHFRDCDNCPMMSIIPAGQFQMGSKTKDYDRAVPVVDVNIAKPFALGTFEITALDWEIYAKDTGQPLASEKRVYNAMKPIERVSWRDIERYLKWLSQKTGKNYRLPSEAEWEWAARGGTNTSFHWGNELGAANANCQSEWTQEVGSYPPNAYGLYDMHCNVFEIVGDCFNTNYEGLPQNGSARTRCDVPGSQVLKGGDYSSQWFKIRNHSRTRVSLSSGFRTPSMPYLIDGGGFRVARDL